MSKLWYLIGEEDKESYYEEDKEANVEPNSFGHGGKVSQDA
jgi:hypothetical protein